jgi:hypothetical protein
MTTLIFTHGNCWDGLLAASLFTKELLLPSDDYVILHVQPAEKENILNRVTLGKPVVRLVFLDVLMNNALDLIKQYKEVPVTIYDHHEANRAKYQEIAAYCLENGIALEGAFEPHVKMGACLMVFQEAKKKGAQFTPLQEKSIAYIAGADMFNDTFPDMFYFIAGRPSEVVTLPKIERILSQKEDFVVECITRGKEVVKQSEERYPDVFNNPECTIGPTGYRVRCIDFDGPKQDIAVFCVRSYLRLLESSVDKDQIINTILAFRRKGGDFLSLRLHPDSTINLLSEEIGAKGHPTAAGIEHDAFVKKLKKTPSTRLLLTARLLGICRWLLAMIPQGHVDCPQ